MHAAGVEGTVMKGDKVASVGSILEILGLGVDAGDVIVLELSEQADDAIAGLADLIEPCNEDGECS
jgi:phosphotransferase system HPr-like phosphotransfer protein